MEQNLVVDSLVDWLPEPGQEVSELLARFVSVATLATGRGSFYETKEDLMMAEKAVHETVHKLNRGLYTLILGVPGVSDRAKSLGIIRLLKNPHKRNASFLSLQQETLAIEELKNQLATHRQHKLMAAIADERITNKRSQKLILRHWFSDNMPWSVLKYRDLAERSLRHAMRAKVGKNTVRYHADVVASILAKKLKWEKLTHKEIDIVNNYLNRFLVFEPTEAQIEATIRFFLGKTNFLERFIAQGCFWMKERFCRKKF